MILILDTHPRIGAAIMFTLAVAAGAAGKERMYRIYDQRDGLAIGAATPFTQDHDGFLWLRTSGGIVRFDGQEMRPWNVGAGRSLIEGAWSSPAGEVLVLPQQRVLYR